MCVKCQQCKFDLYPQMTAIILCFCFNLKSSFFFSFGIFFPIKFSMLSFSSRKAIIFSFRLQQFCFHFVIKVWNHNLTWFLCPSLLSVWKLSRLQPNVSVLLILTHLKSHSLHTVYYCLGFSIQIETDKAEQNRNG